MKVRVFDREKWESKKKNEWRSKNKSKYFNKIIFFTEKFCYILMKHKNNQWWDIYHDKVFKSKSEYF